MFFCIALLALALAMSPILHAQDEVVKRTRIDEMVEQDHVTNQFQGGNTLFNDYSSKKRPPIKGEVHLTKRWQTGIIYFEGGEQKMEVPMRYNMYFDEMEVQHEKSVIFVDAHNIDKIELEFKTFHSRAYQAENEVKEGYFEVLHNGEVSLLLKHAIKIMRSDYNVAMGAGDKADRFEKAKVFYIQKGDEPAYKIKKNKQSILAVFGDKKEAVEKYAKKNKIGFKKAEDLAALFKAYPTL